MAEMSAEDRELLTLQKLREIERSFVDLGVDERRGASAATRYAVGSAETPQDRLATIRKRYPDAQPYGNDNFVFTHPTTGRKTLYNPPGFDAGDVASVVPEGAEMFGGATGVAAALAAAPATGGQSLWTLPAAYGLGSAGGREANNLLAQAMMGTVDTRSLGERSKDAVITGGVNAIGEGVIGRVGEAMAPALSSASRGVSRTMNPSGSENANIMRNAGVDPRLGTVTGSDAVQMVEQVTAATPGGAGPMREAAEREITGLQNEAQRVASGYGPRAEPEVVGAHVRRVAGEAAERFRTRQNQLYDRAFDTVPRETPIGIQDVTPLIQYRNELQLAISRSPAEEGRRLAPTLSRLDGMIEDIQNGMVDFGTLRQWRTNVGRDLKDPVLVGMSSSERAGLDPVYGRLSDAINEIAGQTPDGARLLQTADRYTRRYMTQNAEILQRIVDTDTDGKIYKMLFEAGENKIEGTTLARLRRNLRPEEWDLIAGTVLGRMGTPTAANRGATELGTETAEFSVAKFLTDWNNLSPAAQRVMFGGTRYASLAPQLNNLTKALQLAKNSDKLRNPSGTARILLAGLGVFGGGGAADMAWQGMAGEGSTAASGLVGTAVSLFLAPKMTARLMTNPRFVGWLAQATRLAARGEGSFMRHIGRLATVGKLEPEIKDAVEAYEATLMGED